MGQDATLTAEFPAPLTPRARRILQRAGQEAEDRGATNFIGVEHIFLAILSDDGSVPVQVLARLGLIKQVRQALEEVLSSDGYHTGSNWALDHGGDVEGYLVEAERGGGMLVDENGIPIHSSDDRVPKPAFYDADGPVWAYKSRHGHRYRCAHSDEVERRDTEGS